MLIPPASKAPPKLNLYAASARDEVTVAQNAPQLSPALFRIKAASGSNTTRLRYSRVNPSVGRKPGSGPGRQPGRAAMFPAAATYFPPE